MNNVSLILRILAYKIFDSGRPFYPMNLTLSVTDRCNSKCKTCKIWQKKKKGELGIWEWENILSSLGKSPYFITISGGEPFLNDDLVEIIRLISRNNQPRILNIASNGILTDKISDAMKEVSSFYNGRITVNMSLDGKKEVHNYARGVDCFDNVISTFYSLKALKKISVGMHSVVSRYNTKDFIDFYEFVKSELKPYQHVIEIAENRAELNNLKDEIAPQTSDYLKIINHLQNDGVPFSFRTFLRKKYYRLTRERANKNCDIRCYAGLASAHISSEGELMACCMRCESLGSLKEQGFKQLWHGEMASEIRKRIVERNCSCSLANANLTNLALNWRRLIAL